MNVTGGFANQLFRFACGYQISKKYNQEMVLHIYDKRSYVDAFLLDELCIPNYRKIYTRIASGAEEIAKILELNKIIVIDEFNFEILNEEIFDKDTLVYIDAPFQKTIYFAEYIDQIKNVFQLKNYSEEMHFFKNILMKQNSVAVHVRRRDFIDSRNANGDQSTDSFYKAAIAYFRKIIDKPDFYIFSDDISFCFDFFGGSADIHYVKILGGKDADIEEFFCISWCTHRILTRGSSFGRMADLLNYGSNKITVYQGNDKNKEHIVYLSKEEIKGLSNEYYSTKLQVDKGTVISKIPDLYFNYNVYCEREILSFYLEKIRKQYETGQLEYAEQTLIKAWQYGFDNRLLHMYYYKVLRGLCKKEESLIEAVAFLKCGGKKEEITKKFDSLDVDKIEAFLKKGVQRFIIIPKEPYRNAELNQLCNLGILLQRMGHEVYYFFHKAQEGDGVNTAVNNEILMSNYMYTNCEGYKYQSKMYDLDIIKKQYDLDQFIGSIIGNKSCYVISDDICIFEQCRSENMQRIYWKAVNTYRYYHGNVQPSMQSFPEVDRVVSDEKKSGQTDKDIVINRIPLFFETDKKISLSKQYTYDEELFYVIEQLMLR